MRTRGRSNTKPYTNAGRVQHPGQIRRTPHGGQTLYEQEKLAVEDMKTSIKLQLLQLLEEIAIVEHCWRFKEVHNYIWTAKKKKSRRTQQTGLTWQSPASSRPTAKTKSWYQQNSWSPPPAQWCKTVWKIPNVTWQEKLIMDWKTTNAQTTESANIDVSARPYTNRIYPPEPKIVLRNQA